MGRLPRRRRFPPRRTDRPQRRGADRLLRGAANPESRRRRFAGRRRLPARRDTPVAIGLTTPARQHGSALAGQRDHRRPQTGRTGRILPAAARSAVPPFGTDVLDLQPALRPARGDPQGAGSDTRRGRGQRPAGATRQCRGAGKGTAPGPEGNHRRDDPPAQKMHGTHAHRPDGSLRRQHATDRPRPRGRRYAIHPGALIFPCRKDKTGLFS